MSDIVYDTPQDAEKAFYAALAACDLDAMMAVWAPDDEAVCIHPDGSRQQGVAAIRAMWRQMFAGGGSFTIRIERAFARQAGTLAVHGMYEHFLYGDGREAGPPVLATNVLERDGRGWRMVLHHASPPAQAEAPEEVPTRLH